MKRRISVLFSPHHSVFSRVSQLRIKRDGLQCERECAAGIGIKDVLMKRWQLVLTFTAAVVVLTACADTGIPDGPRLISEVTLPPVTVAPTRPQNATPLATEPTSTPRVMTLTAAPFDLVTPTLPPSKTPTVTPTITLTPTITPTVARTSTAAPTRETRLDEQQPVLVPTIELISPDEAIARAPLPTDIFFDSDVSFPAAGVPNVPLAQCTQAQWFFTYPVLPDCPPNPPAVSDGAFMGFEYGYMFWIGSQDAIYVLFLNEDQPRWQVFQDRYEDGMPDRDGSLDALAPPYADWQPRRGFGLVWRETPGMIDRIGWAQSEYEAAYRVSIQTRSDGTIFISDPRGRLFALASGGRDWHLYGP